MILALTKYINEVLLCSPLIPKLFFVRDFLTQTIRKESVETSFRTARELSMKDSGAQQMMLEVVAPNQPFLARTSLNETGEVEEDKNMLPFVGDSYSQGRADSFQQAFDAFSGAAFGGYGGASGSQHQGYFLQAHSGDQHAEEPENPMEEEDDALFKFN